MVFGYGVAEAGGFSYRFGRRWIMHDALPEGNGAGGFADQRGDVRNYRALHGLHAF